MEKREVRRRIYREATEEEKAKYAEIRRLVMEEFPPKYPGGRPPSPPGLPSRIREAREARGLTWHELAKLAGIENSGTIRDFEYGHDAPLSSIEAVAKVLGLKLELVEVPT